MSEPKLSEDFKQMGDNLVEVLRAAWERPERKAIQSELESGLSELGAALSRAAAEFSESEVGQKLKEDVQDLRERVETGEVEASVRKDVRTAMETVNRELEKLAKKIRSDQAG